jgi:hypothetical protein
MAGRGVRFTGARKAGPEMSEFDEVVVSPGVLTATGHELAVEGV